MSIDDIRLTLFIATAIDHRDRTFVARIRTR